MASTPNSAKAPASNIELHDPVWSAIREEAKLIAKSEPCLGSFIMANVLNHDTLEEAIAHRIAIRLDSKEMPADLLEQTFSEIFAKDKSLRQVVRADLAAVYDRDPACHRLIDPLLYFKGFHALQTHRMAHALWTEQRRDFALYLQSRNSSVFQVDIHPAAKLGKGLMFDHATGLVIGETARVEDNTSILHGVTLGGSGNEQEDRHPKIGCNVMIGAGAKVLGNITVGACSRVAAGSVVVKDVPPESTVAGVPARVIGHAGCSEPSRTMDQMIQDALEAAIEQATAKG